MNKEPRQRIRKSTLAFSIFLSLVECLRAFKVSLWVFFSLLLVLFLSHSRLNGRRFSISRHEVFGTNESFVWASTASHCRCRRAHDRHSQNTARAVWILESASSLSCFIYCHGNKIHSLTLHGMVFSSVRWCAFHNVSDLFWPVFSCFVLYFPLFKHDLLCLVGLMCNKRLSFISHSRSQCLISFRRRSPAENKTLYHVCVCRPWTYLKSRVIRLDRQTKRIEWEQVNRFTKCSGFNLFLWNANSKNHCLRLSC